MTGKGKEKVILVILVINISAMLATHITQLSTQTRHDSDSHQTFQKSFQHSTVGIYPNSLSSFQIMKTNGYKLNDHYVTITA